MKRKIYMMIAALCFMANISSISYAGSWQRKDIDGDGISDELLYYHDDGTVWKIDENNWLRKNEEGIFVYAEPPMHYLDYAYDEKSGLKPYYQDGLPDSEYEETKYGYADSEGNVVIPAQYYYPAYSFHNGYAVVRNTPIGKTTEEGTIKFSYIDTSGNVLFSCFIPAWSSRAEPYFRYLDNDPNGVEIYTIHSYSDGMKYWAFGRGGVVVSKFYEEFIPIPKTQGVSSVGIYAISEFKNGRANVYRPDPNRPYKDMLGVTYYEFDTIGSIDSLGNFSTEIVVDIIGG